jgi:hypothetical protein
MDSSAAPGMQSRSIVSVMNPEWYPHLDGGLLEGFGFRVSGLRFRVSDFGFRRESAPAIQGYLA